MRLEVSDLDFALLAGGIIMKSTSSILLTFIGGPFDGFDGWISSDEELPQCIDVPLNAAAAQIFGMNFGTTNIPKFAIYRRRDQGESVSYRFHRTHTGKTTAGSDPSS